MAKRAPDAMPLGRVALLPTVPAYEDMEGVGGAWQQLMDRIKVRAHLLRGGRIHVAVEDRWLIAYPAQVWPVVIGATFRTSDQPGATVVDADGMHTMQPDGTLGPWKPQTDDALRPPEPPC